MDQSTLDIIEKTRRRREALERKKAELCVSPVTSDSPGKLHSTEELCGTKRRTPLSDVKNTTPNKESPPKRQKNDNDQESENNTIKFPSFDHLEARPSFRARKTRLARLADNINSWDDDLNRVDYRESPEKPKRVWTPPQSPSAQYNSPQMTPNNQKSNLVSSSPEKPKVWTPPKSPSTQYNSPKKLTSNSKLVDNTDNDKPKKGQAPAPPPAAPAYKEDQMKINKTPSFIKTPAKSFSPVKFSPKSPSPIKPNPVVAPRINGTPGKRTNPSTKATSSTTVTTTTVRTKLWEEATKRMENNEDKSSEVDVQERKKIWEEKKEDISTNRRESFEPTKMPVFARKNIWEKRIEESEAQTKKEVYTPKRVNKPSTSVTPQLRESKSLASVSQEVAGARTPAPRAVNQTPKTEQNSAAMPKLENIESAPTPPIPIDPKTGGKKGLVTEYERNLRAMGFEINSVANIGHVATADLTERKSKISKEIEGPRESTPKPRQVEKSKRVEENVTTSSIYKFIKAANEKPNSNVAQPVTVKIPTDDDFYTTDEDPMDLNSKKERNEKIRNPDSIKQVRYEDDDEDDDPDYIEDDDVTEEAISTEESCETTGSYSEETEETGDNQYDDDENDEEYTLGSIDSESSLEENRKRTPTTHERHVHFKPTSSSSSDTASVSSSSSMEQPTVTMRVKPIPAKRNIDSDVATTTDDEQPYYISVDMYRKSSNLSTAPSPVKTIVRQSEMHKRGAAKLAGETVSVLKTPKLPEPCVKQRLAELEATVQHQQNVIVQTSNALNTISNDSPFAGGSVEQVECNRLLLVACKRREAALAERNKLKALGKVPNSEGPRGSITLSDIRLPLKTDFMGRVGTQHDKYAHFFIVSLRQRDRVVFTEMVSTHDGMVRGLMEFPNMVKFSDITQDFKIDVEVYTMSVPLNQPMSPFKKKTPKKSKIAHPHGPNVVRISNFAQVTSTMLDMNSLGKNHFGLERVPKSCPLSGSLHVTIQCSMESTIEESGWLTMFEDVSGLGAWDRRWCKLKNGRIFYWKYPSEEKENMEPIGFIDLKNCITESIDLIPRDICARPNTFELVCVRRQTRGDHDTLVMSCSNTMTSTRFWLSADTREERIVWCDVLNEALLHLRAWNVDALRPIKAPPRRGFKYESNI